MSFLDSKRRCLSCNNEYHPSDFAVISTIHKDAQGKPLVLVPPRTGLRKLFWEEPELTGPEYARHRARYQCPNCGTPQPPDRGELATIAIIGDTTSGKSHFIAALIHQFQNEYMAQASNDVIFLFEGSSQDMEKRYMKEYYTTLFRDRQPLDGNQPGDVNNPKILRPLIYELTIKAPPRTQRVVTLSFYDIAGEDLVEQDKLVQLNPHILNADAMIFLTDPLALPALKGLLDPHIALQASSNIMLPSFGFRWIINTFKQHRQEERLSIPIAITLSKSDLLKYLRSPAGDAFTFTNSPTYHKVIDLEDLQQVDAEVREIIRTSGDNMLLQVSNAASYQTAFFATSATGCALDTQGEFPFVKPCRCIDPLLWILWKKRYIDAPR